MTDKTRYTINFAAAVRLSTVIAFLFAWMLGCNLPQPPEPPPPPLPAESLLLQVPYFNDETELRDPLPEPARMLLDETSVQCWTMTADTVLRFPVELRESARLSFRLGASTTVPLRMDDLTVRAEFVPEIEPSETPTNTGELVPIFESTIRQTPDFFYGWVHVDVDLESCAPGTGEIRFSAECPEELGHGIHILWGEPVLYHPAEARHRNVILIGVDTLRRDAVEPYGGRIEVSPNISRLSGSATKFTRAWSQAPFTGPSFASMLTGRFPAEVRPTFSSVHLPESADTIAETLIQHGYATAMVCGNPYLGKLLSGFHQGMEEMWFRHNAPPGATIEMAIDFIDRTRDRDWFLFLHFIDPHGPYDPPEEFIDSLCDPDYEGPYETAFRDMPQWRNPPVLPPTRDIERVRSLYDAEVADVDSAIGELFEFLDENQLLDDTLIILAADHGEEFYEHDQWGHGQSLYEEMVHLGLMVWGEDFPKGREVDTTVGNIDIVPTILTYFDLPLPDELPGLPLQDAIAGNMPQDRMMLGEGSLRGNYHHKFTVEWPYKCILDFFTGEARLYDLVNDPDEREDISHLHPELTERLAAETIRAMKPIQTNFVLLIAGDTENGPDRFTGTIRAPGGINFVYPAGLLELDHFSYEDDTMEFSLLSDTGIEGGLKALIVVPTRNDGSIDVDILSDGEVDPDRFFPYGTPTPEPAGSATVNIFDYPIPGQIPADARRRPVACYIVGFPGFPEDGSAEFEQSEFDPETLEQLRALGYIN